MRYCFGDHNTKPIFEIKYFCLRIPKKMADEALSRAGLHFDELNKIRVLEPEIQQQTSELKEECKEFVDSKKNLYYVN